MASRSSKSTIRLVDLYTDADLGHLVSLIIGGAANNEDVGRQVRRLTTTLDEYEAEQAKAKIDQYDPRGRGHGHKPKDDIVVVNGEGKCIGTL